MIGRILFPGLDPTATLRERYHYRRHGTWPASHFQRMLAQHGREIAKEDAELIVDFAKTVVKDIRREIGH
jgi:hypothetical protein